MERVSGEPGVLDVGRMIHRSYEWTDPGDGNVTRTPKESVGKGNLKGSTLRPQSEKLGVMKI